MISKSYKKLASSIGNHIIADFWNCDSCRLLKSTLYKDAIVRSNKVMGTTLLKVHIEKFIGGGHTAFGILAESHISLHSFPEDNYLSVDIFTCGDKDLRKGLQIIIDIFKPKNVDIMTISRGTKEKEKFWQSIDVANNS